MTEEQRYHPSRLHEADAPGILYVPTSIKIKEIVEDYYGDKICLYCDQTICDKGCKCGSK